MKRWKKRVLALVLAATCILPGTSCAAPQENVNQEQPTPTQGLTATPTQVLEGEKSPEAAGVNNALGEDSKDTTARQLTTAVYPEMAPYPETDGIHYDEAAYEAWRTSRQAQQPDNKEYQNGIRNFYEATMQEFLKDTEGKNKIYSPLNIYMALAMLAETAEGESRQQILDLLGVDSIETLRNNASILWNANYCDDGTVTSLLASSAWLSDKINYNQETLNTLAENYYASSFSGTMGSAEYNKLLQDWLNEQTGGLLKEQASQIEMDPLTVFALATTVYFKAKWADEFNEANNTQKIFHGASGDVTAEFMHQSRTGTYYWGENFGAISRNLTNSGNMLLILPDEGVNVEDLLTDEEVLDFIYNRVFWENQKTLIINQSIPKFDVVSDFSLISGLKNLGITDVFDFETADFTPLTTDTDVAVSGATHAARVLIDEEGCLAAAFTVMVYPTAARPPEEQMDFVLDRPFLFVINGQDAQPLFIGIVNQPK